MVARHHLYFSDAARSKDALKRKFATLYGTRSPTGDPTIPPDVLRAKRAYEEIKQKAEISEGEDELDEDGQYDYFDDDDAKEEQQQGEEGKYTTSVCLYDDSTSPNNIILLCLQNY